MEPTYTTLTRTPSRDAILEADDLVIEFVPTPEWPCDLYVKSLTGSDRDAWEGSLLVKNGKGRREVSYQDIRAKLVAKTACDAEGNLLFKTSDVIALGKKNSAALSRVFDVARKLSGLTEDDVKELEDELKNDQPAGLPSDLRDT
jgi:hypothetical protein